LSVQFSAPKQNDVEFKSNSIDLLTNTSVELNIDSDRVEHERFVVHVRLNVEREKVLHRPNAK